MTAMAVIDTVVLSNLSQLFAHSVVQKIRFLFNQKEIDQFFAETVFDPEIISSKFTY